MNTELSQLNVRDILHKPLRIAILLGVAMLFSCKTDLQTIENITKVDDSPVESAYNIEVIYSEGASIKMVLTAPRMDRYEGEKNFMEMPEGVQVLFYDSLMNVSSSMTANYAISHEDDERVEARNDVVVINEMNEKLNTELLVWDQKNSLIFSDTFVKITTEDEVLYGEGLEADERFNQWTIKRPRGTFTVDTQEKEND